VQDLTLSIAQLLPTLLDVRGNTGKILDLMEDASRNGSDLLFLPEMALTGYGVGEAIKDPCVRKMVEAETRSSLEEIRKAGKRLKLDVLVSYPLFSGKKVYIAAEYLQSGKRAALHRKINLCNYDHYTEHLHFAEGNSPTVARGGKAAFGLLLCEDSWHALNGIVETLCGAEVLLVPAAPCVPDLSEGKASIARWETITKGTAFLQTSFVVMGSLVGTEKNLNFLGGSHVVSPEGEILLRLPLFEEAVVQVRLEAALLENTRQKRPLLRNERICVYREAFGKMTSRSAKMGSSRQKRTLSQEEEV